MTLICVGWAERSEARRDRSLVIVDLEEQAAEVRLERPVHRAGRPAGIGAGREAQQPRAAAVLLRLVERAGEDLLLDADGIARRRLPAAAHVEPVEFEM